MWTVRPLRRSDAVAILNWRYPPPYHIYQMIGTDPSELEWEETISFLVGSDSDYFAVGNGNELIGFGCTGVEAQVPGYEYTTVEAVDVGLGMRPNLVGQGLGSSLLSTILEHLSSSYQPQRFRATIAEFNQRSQALFRRAGFQTVDRFQASNPPQRPFLVYLLNGNPDPDLPIVE